MKVRDRILVITDLFLGALWADEEFTEDEQRAVRKLLADLMLCTPDDLPTNVEDRIAGFDPLTFDLEGATKDFEADPPMAKRRLLELVGKMVDADGVMDMKEDEYLRRLAKCLDMDYDEYSDLVLDYEIEELRESFEALRTPPPPMVASDGRSSRPPPPPIVDEIAAPNVGVGALPPPPPLVDRDDE
ncbi:MAG: TerB family tellurite resistance protein [Sandaracinaceae bacterium]|nr:MAG: TerB family tellurite resistance protein [Sandaracinaceae bacterium]